jgi:hypothetical protein
VALRAAPPDALVRTLLGARQLSINARLLLWSEIHCDHAGRLPAPVPYVYRMPDYSSGEFADHKATLDRAADDSGGIRDVRVRFRLSPIAQVVVCASGQERNEPHQISEQRTSTTSPRRVHLNVSQRQLTSVENWARTPPMRFPVDPFPFPLEDNDVAASCVRKVISNAGANNRLR